MSGRFRKQVIVTDGFLNENYYFRFRRNSAATWLSCLRMPLVRVCRGIRGKQMNSCSCRGSWFICTRANLTRCARLSHLPCLDAERRELVLNFWSMNAWFDFIGIAFLSMHVERPLIPVDVSYYFTRMRTFCCSRTSGHSPLIHCWVEYISKGKRGLTPIAKNRTR